MLKSTDDAQLHHFSLLVQAGVHKGIYVLLVQVIFVVILQIHFVLLILEMEKLMLVCCNIIKLNVMFNGNSSIPLCSSK